MIFYKIRFRIFKIVGTILDQMIANFLTFHHASLVSLKDTGGRYYLRSNDGKLFNIPSCKSLSTLDDRSFYMAAPKLRNDHPFFIRNIFSVNAFKKALKTHLFQKAFPS